MIRFIKLLWELACVAYERHHAAMDSLPEERRREVEALFATMRSPLL